MIFDKLLQYLGDKWDTWYCVTMFRWYLWYLKAAATFKWQERMCVIWYPNMHVCVPYDIYDLWWVCHVYNIWGMKNTSCNIHVTRVTTGTSDMWQVWQVEGELLHFLLLHIFCQKKSAVFPFFTLIDKVFNQLSFERIEYRKQIQRISETDHHVILWICWIW